MWAQTSTFLALVAATLNSLAVCDETAPEEDSKKTVWFGKLVVGDDDQLASPNGDLTTPAVDADGFQADQPANIRTDGHRLAELKLQRLSPSVQCDAESMTLRLRGNRLPDFLVDRDEESPVALSQLPDHCGFSVRRGRRDVILVAKYDGCHVSREANSYILPLYAWGSPVKMACPVYSLPIRVTCTPSEMVVKVRSVTDGIKVKVSGEMKPLAQAVIDCGFTLETVSSVWLVKAPLSSSCLRAEGGELLLSLLFMDRDLTLSCPEVHAAATSAPATAAAPPVVQDFKFPLPNAPLGYPVPYDDGMPWHWPFPHGHGHPKSPTVAPTTPTTTTVAPATAAAPPVVQDFKFPLPNFPQAPLGYPFPYGPGMPWHWPFPHGHGHPKSPTVAPLTPTTTTVVPATAAAPPVVQDFKFPLPNAPLDYPFPYDDGKHWPLPHGHGHPKSPTVASRTPTTTTVVPATAAAPPVVQDVKFPLPNFPQAPLGYPFPYGHGMPGHWPLPHSHGHPKSPTVAPATAAAPPVVQDVKFPLPNFPQAPLGYPFPYGHGMPGHWPLPHGHGHPKSTTIAPTTPSTTTATTTSADWVPLPWIPDSEGKQTLQRPPMHFPSRYPVMYPTGKSPSVPSGQMAFPPNYTWQIPHFLKY